MAKAQLYEPKLYKLGDHHPERQLHTNGKIYNGVMAINSKQFRCPKKGEWFLSGAIALAYKAPNDLSQEYYIATIVNVSTTIEYHIEEIPNE